MFYVETTNDVTDTCEVAPDVNTLGDVDLALALRRC